MAASRFAQIQGNFQDLVTKSTKLTEHERTLFLSGATMVIYLLAQAIEEASNTNDLQISWSLIQQLKHEARLFRYGPMHELHKFYCDDCAKEEGDRHVQ